MAKRQPGMQVKKRAARIIANLELLLFLALHICAICKPWQRISRGDILRGSVYHLFHRLQPADLSWSH